MPKTDTWTVIENVMQDKGLRRAVLYGPPGTGKTYAALTQGLYGRAVWNVTLTEEMAAAEMRGHYVPKGGVFEWMHAAGIQAALAGGRLVVNEIQRVSGDLTGFLLALCDDKESARITLPTGETIIPAEGFQVIATMNGDPDCDLDPALRDRFPVCALPIETVHPQALERLPEDLRAAASKSVLATEVERRVSVRVWLEFARMRAAIDVATAAAACFGERAGDVLNGLKIGGA